MLFFGIFFFGSLAIVVGLLVYFTVNRNKFDDYTDPKEFFQNLSNTTLRENNLDIYVK